MSRRELGRFAATLGLIGLGGAVLDSGGTVTAQPVDQTQETTDGDETQQTRLTQLDLTRIIDNQANALLGQLQSKAPRPDYAVAVAFAYPGGEFQPFFMYGTTTDETPPTSSTIFSIGPITKTFTSALFANGVITHPDCFDWDAGLDRYLARYFGDTGTLSPTMQQITPRMLARHVSGLPRNSDRPDEDGAGLLLDGPSNAPTSLLDLWRNHDGPQPGSCWRYSNLGFVTLGFAAVSAYGCAAGEVPPGAQAYANLLRSQITEPLGMSDTVTIAASGAATIRAYPNGGLGVPSDGAIDIKSSAADMHTWLLAQLTAPSQSSPLMTALATTTQPSPLSVDFCDEPAPGPTDMGLAWQIEPGPPEIAWKDGQTPEGGCSCWIGITPASPTQEPLGIAILANGFWDKDKPEVIANPYGKAMLEQISAAV